MTKVKEKIDVATICLDDFFERVIGNGRLDFIKMNVQGAEGFVIDGAKRCLKNNNVIMITEFWPEGLKECGTDPAKLLSGLKELGYRWWPVSHHENGERQYSIEETIQLGNEFIDKKKMCLHLVVSKL